MNNTNKRNFYRLENEAGIGIYRAAFAISNDFKYNDFNDKNLHPGPKQDSKLWEQIRGYNNDYQDFDPYLIFGFESVVQYRSWFYNDEVLLRAKTQYNIQLNLYVVDCEPDSFLGNAQMVADKNKIELVGECEILTGELIKN